MIVSFSAGWKIKEWKYDSQYKQSYLQAMAEIKTQDLVNQKMAQEYQRKTLLYTKKVELLNVQVKTEVASHSIYTSCAMPDSGLQLINSAVDTANQAVSS